MEGEELTEMASLREAGAAGFSDDGLPIRSARVLRRALQYQRLCGGTIALHEEDPELSGAGVMHEGPVSAALGLAGIPSVSESTMIARDAALAGYEGGRIHVQHLSAAESVEAVRAAKAAGVQISCEASPHHLCLTDEEVRSLDPHRFKMNPPLRSEADRQALIEGLRDGTIECIATDHAPHAAEEKEVPFEQAAMGVTGLETAFAALHTELVLPGALDLGLLVERLAGGAEPFGIERPVADPGQRGQRRPLRPRRRVDGGRGRLREPLVQLLVRRPQADRPGADDACRRPGRLSPALLHPRSRSVSEASCCSRTGPASTGCSAAAEGPVTGEVVFNTAMTGYQESVTDPSYAGQIIVFTYPLIGNYGVSAAAMESDRIHARGVVMRDAKNGEDVATAEGGWLDWLADCGVPGIGGVDTRAVVRHIRDRGAMRGGIFPAGTPEGEARERVAAEPSMDGADLARTVTPPEPVRFEGDGPHVVGIDTGVKLNIVRQLRERGCRVTLLPCTSQRRGGARRGARPRLPRQRPRRPCRPRLRRRHRPRSGRQASRSSASASATSCSAARSAWRPSSCPSATAAPTTRSRSWRRAGSTSPRRTTASPSQGPGGEPRIEADEPVRWETDFGAAELSHLNLYDRTVEGLVLKDVAARDRPVPPRGRARPARRPPPLRLLPGARPCLSAPTSRRSC